MPRETGDTERLDRVDQHAFRIAAAGLIKSLIRARARKQPNFLNSSDYQRWGVTKLAEESRSCDQLLRSVRRLHDQFEKRFLQEQDSIPDPASAEDADSFDMLREKVASFIDVDALNRAIESAARNKPVRWKLLANWDSLGTLRDALDKLPSVSAENATGAQSMPPIPELPIILITPQSATIEWQNTTHHVSHPTAEAFQAMIHANGQPIGLGKYVRKPAEWIKKLGVTDSDLAAIVARAEGNRGYRVTIFDPIAR